MFGTVHSPRRSSCAQIQTRDQVLAYHDLKGIAVSGTERSWRMFGLQELLESTIEEMLANGNVGKYPTNELKSSVEDMIPGLVDETASLIMARIRTDAPSGLKDRQRDRRGFEKRLNDRWKYPLELLDLAIALSTEAGTEFNRKYRNEAVGSGDAVFEVLTRLHARGCQVSGEVLALLRSGFADGAHARWRSLHEMAVVASLIEQHGQELAERYLLHEPMQQYKLACEYQRFFDRLDVEPPPKEDLDELRVRRDELIDRFGESFKGDYGWAASAIGSNRPTMSDIEQQVQLDHMRPYYRMASDNVHANAHGAHFRLGLHSAQEKKVLLAGPSNLGLADPGHSTAISLLQITTNLLATQPVFDCAVTMKVLEELTNEVGEAFLKVHQELESMVPDDDESWSH